MSGFSKPTARTAHGKAVPSVHALLPEIWVKSEFSSLSPEENKTTKKKK